MPMPPPGDTNGKLNEQLAQLPKAEIHLHLEGSIDPETAVLLARQRGVALKPEDVLSRYASKDFPGFIEAFKWITYYLQTPEDYFLVAQRLAEELLRQNVIHAEVTLSAGVMLKRKQNVEANLAAIREGVKAYRIRGLRFAWILDAVRQLGPDEAMKVAHIAAKLQHLGVVAFGMGGDELALPAGHFRAVYQFARGEGLHVVTHAGEIGGPDSVRDAVEILGSQRIGHGIGVMHDPKLAESLAWRNVPLEICLTSNLCTGALAKQVSRPEASLTEHPLKRFVEQGLTVTLSTDDPAMFRTDLLNEYRLAASLGLEAAQIVRIAEASFTSAFLPPEGRRKLIGQFRAAAKSLGLL